MANRLGYYATKNGRILSGYTRARSKPEAIKKAQAERESLYLAKIKLWHYKPGSIWFMHLARKGCPDMPCGSITQYGEQLTREEAMERALRVLENNFSPKGRGKLHVADEGYNG